VIIVSAEENKAVVLRWWDAQSSAAYDLATLDELVAPDFVYHNPGQPEVHTHEQRRQKIIIEFTAAFPDIKYDLKDIIAEGDKVALRYSISATHKGEFMGIAPTNKRVELTSLCMLRLANGKVAEMWVENNSLVMLMQLGVFPLPAGYFHVKQ
jgi:predicted ester cyclase